MPSSLFDIASLAPLLPGGQTFLTPNLRLARRIQSEWDTYQRSQGRAVWEPLPVYPIERWLLSQWKFAVQKGLLEPKLLLSKVQEQLLWQRIIAEHSSSGGELTLLRPAAAAELAAEARDTLLRWDISPDSESIAQTFKLEVDCASFLSWSQVFVEELCARSLNTSADAIAELADVAPTLSRSPITLIACEDLAPLVKRALKGLSSSLGQQALVDHAATETVRAYANTREELEGVARWVAQQHRNAPHETTGIVLSGSGSEQVTLDYLLRREFDCLGENYTSLPVNFSAGIPLAGVPVVRDALAALGLGLDSVSIAEVVSILHSRFLHLPDARTPLVQRFVRKLYEDGSEKIQVSALRNFANEVGVEGSKGTQLGGYLLEMFRLRELTQPANPSVWSERFAEVLSLWGWPGQGSLDSLEFQQVTLWYETLELFKSLDVVSGTLSYAEALQRLGEFCHQQVSHPQTRDSNIHVLGPLEAVGLSFDHLWVCAMQAGAWPSPPRPNPFIPTTLQAKHDMPHSTPEREWHFATSLLQQYRRDSGAVHFSYSRQIDGVPDLASALIAGATEDVVPPAYAEVDVPTNMMTKWHERHLAVELESLADDEASNPSTEELESIRGGAGLIEDQSQCPFRAFAHRWLMVTPLPEPTLGLSASERGTLVHTALQILWQQIECHSNLISLTEDECKTSVSSAARKAIAAIPDRRRIAVGADCMDLEASRLDQLLKEWLAIEKRRGDFKIAALEQDVELTLSRLTIRLRVDRIDQLPDGGQVVIDYKTGISKVGDWMGERPAKPQLLLYASVLKEPPAALAFAQLRTGDSAYIGIGTTEDIPGVKTDLNKELKKAFKESDESIDWKELNALWQARLLSLAEEFVNGVARVDPIGNACNWCGLQSLCRIQSDNAGPLGSDEGEVA